MGYKKIVPHLSILAIVILLSGLFLTINASRENQDTRSKAAGTNNPLPLTTDGIHQFLVFNYQEPNEPGGFLQEQGVIDYVWGSSPGTRGRGNYAVPGVWHEVYIAWPQDGDTFHTIDWFITNHPDWIQYTSNTCSGVSTYKTANCVATVMRHAQTPLDYTNPAVQAYLFSDFIDPYMTANPPYNGISFDDNPSINWGNAKGHWDQNGNWVAQYSGKVYDDPAWTRAQASALQQIRTTFKAKYPTGSITVNDGYYMGESATNWGAELQYADMFLQEGGFFSRASPTRHTTSIDTAYIRNAWLSLATMLAQKQKTLGIGLGIISQVPYAMTYHVTDTNQQAKEDVQWALANYLLIKYDHTFFWIGGTDERTYNNYGQGPSVLAQREFDPQYRDTNANAIGHPINRGNGSDFYAAQNVYMRDYSNGLAIVNPSPTTAYTIYLPANVFKDLYGNRIGNTITLQPASGVVLLGSTTTPIALSSLTWQNLINTTATGSTLTKTGGASGWTAGARSTQTLASGDGYAEITITDNNTQGRMFGLNHDNTTVSYTDIDYAFYFASSGVLQIIENGVGRTSGLTYAVGDKFKVIIQNGIAKYYKNGTVLYTSTQTPIYPLFIDVSLRDTNAKITTGNLGTLPPPLSNITWINPVNVEVSNDRIIKTGGTSAWDAGAISSQQITSGDGYAEITINDNTNDGRIFGLNHDNTSTNYTDIDHAFYFASSGKLQLFENGSLLPGSFTYAVGDKFKVAIENGVIKYYRNGSLLYTSTRTPIYPLFIDVSLRDPNSRITSGNLITPPAPISNLTWANPSNVAINSSTITKTGGTNGSWDAGAISTQTIASGTNGYAEITINDNNTQGRMFGLNHENTTAAHTDIDYAFYFASSGVLQLYENGTNKSSGHTYAIGDKFKVALENGVVKYYKNDSLLYTSTQTPVSPLFVDVSLRDTNAKIATANIVSLTSPTPTPTAAPTLTPTPRPTNTPTPTPTPVNLALNRPVTAGSAFSSTYAPSKAVDGSTSTYWISKNTARWITVDLGALKNISKFVIKHSTGTYTTKYFTIQTSSDNANWTTVVNVNNNTASTTTHTIPTRSARYVRLNIVTPAQNTYPYAIIPEFEIY